MTKLRKDVRAELEGVVAAAKAGVLSFKTYPATVSIGRGLMTAGIDYKPVLQAMLKLNRHEQKMLEDKVIKPSDLGIPYPLQYGDQQTADLCASLASSIKSDRQSMWTRGLAIAGVIVTLVVALLALL